MEPRVDEKVRALIDRGVVIPDPGSVFIADNVDLGMIAPGATVHPSCRISGWKTAIMYGAVLGAEGPVVVDSCQIGPRVELKGGFFRKSTFLEGSNLGLGAHVRDACLLEEEAGGAHTVGLKHTVLLPFVTLGSLINFCDCLMAGGTSRKNHSEVGSSYIHFNYTPNQDKATASLIGDVPRGVMLDERPIFLGGQGGLVGPSLVAFGTVVGAGTVLRGDVLEPGKLVLDQEPRPEVRDFHPAIYWDIHRKVRNNVAYIANLIALKAWYRLVRVQFFGEGALDQALFRGALEKIDMAIVERVERLGAVAKKMPESVRAYTALMKDAVNPVAIARKQELSGKWHAVEAAFASLNNFTGSDALRDDFLAELITGRTPGEPYIKTIQTLDPRVKALGVTWLQDLVSSAAERVLAEIPSYR
jgi:hypothetical protein